MTLWFLLLDVLCLFEAFSWKQCLLTWGTLCCAWWWKFPKSLASRWWIKVCLRWLLKATSVPISNFKFLYINRKRKVNLQHQNRFFGLSIYCDQTENWSGSCESLLTSQASIDFNKVHFKKYRKTLVFLAVKIKSKSLWFLDGHCYFIYCRVC